MAIHELVQGQISFSNCQGGCFKLSGERPGRTDVWVRVPHSGVRPMICTFGGRRGQRQTLQMITEFRQGNSVQAIHVSFLDNIDPSTLHLDLCNIITASNANADGKDAARIFLCRLLTCTKHA
jgi:predicted metal-binding protein